MEKKEMPLPYEPKRQKRYKLTLPENFELRSDLIVFTERPKIKINNGVLEYLTIPIVINDPIGPSTTQQVWKLFLGIDGYEYVRERYSEQKGFDYDLELYDPTGVVVEKWKIEGCTVSMIDFGSLSMDDDDIATCTLFVKPKNVTLLF